MIQRLLAWCLIALVGLSALSGCTGSRDKGKNQDLDRPTPDTRR
jgi:hypothetical protein